MNKVKNMKIEIIDEDHIYVNNRQFISINRFSASKNDAAKELNFSANKNKELAEENKALRMLLKNQLNESIEE